MSEPARLPVFTLDTVLAMGAQELVRAAPVDVVAGATSHLNVPFGLKPGYRMLRLDLHVPHRPRTGAPLITYCSGGAWILSMKHHGPWQFLLEHGYAVAVIEYRLSGEVRYPGQIHDLKAAVRWLRSHGSSFGVDPTHVVAFGSSAGGYISAMVAATNGRPDFEGDMGQPDASSRVDGVIDHCGAVDLANMAADTNDVPGAIEPFGTDTSPETRLLGYRPVDRPADAAAASPPAYLSPATVPFLVMHGDADTRLGIRQSERFHGQLRAAGVDSEFHVVPGANHGTPEFDSDEVHAIELAWLERLEARLRMDPPDTDDVQPYSRTGD